MFASVLARQYCVQRDIQTGADGKDSPHSVRTLVRCVCHGCPQVHGINQAQDVVQEINETSTFLRGRAVWRV